MQGFNVPREEMIREIIKSFITAYSEKKFCEKLTIVISEDDYRKQGIDLQGLGNYLRHLCRYTDIKSKTDAGKGRSNSGGIGSVSKFPMR